MIRWYATGPEAVCAVLADPEALGVVILSPEKLPDLRQLVYKMTGSLDGLLAFFLEPPDFDRRLQQFIAHMQSGDPLDAGTRNMITTWVDWQVLDIGELGNGHYQLAAAPIESLYRAVHIFIASAKR
jgi:hypothetical protein